MIQCPSNQTEALNHEPSLEWQIVPYEPEHHEACVQLLATIPQWFGIPEANAAYFREMALHPSWVAVPDNDAGVVLGALTVTQPMPESYEIHFVAVARNRHRSGIGSRLMGFAEQWARARGGQFMQVKTVGPSSKNEDYAKTRVFYEAIGYTPLFETDRLWDPHNPALTLVKHLTCGPHSPRGE